VLLVTRDDQLWPQVGGNLGQDLVLKQVDTIDEMLSTTTSGQPAIVLLDARGEADGAAALSRLQLHSPRFAVVALDDVGSGHTWTGAIALRQVVAHVAVPIQADKLIQAIENAHEEVNARVALLGESGAVTPDGTGTSSTARKIPWIPIAVTLAAAAPAFLP
jgi:DNA-binding NtrC family response regulator